MPNTRYVISVHGLTVTEADTGTLKLSVTAIDLAAESDMFVTAKPSVP